MQKEGNQIRDNNIHAVPILKLLDFYHVKYTIVMGCWAGGTVNKYNLEFTDCIIQNKYYAMLVGKLNEIRFTNSYFMRGTQEMAGHMLRYAPNAEAEWRNAIHPWDPPEGVINIQYPKKHIWHLSHFTAYINAYEFVKMADQLMRCELCKVIQIQKDDFMHYTFLGFILLCLFVLYLFVQQTKHARSGPTFLHPYNLLMSLVSFKNITSNRARGTYQMAR